MKETAVRKYLVVSGVVFGLVALGHLFRVSYGFDMQFGPVSVPMWASWLAFVWPGILCGWAFSLARK